MACSFDGELMAGFHWSLCADSGDSSAGTLSQLILVSKFNIGRDRLTYQILLRY
jgi:hypothetical protein